MNILLRPYIGGRSPAYLWAIYPLLFIVFEHSLKRCMTLALWDKILNIQSSGHAREPHRIRQAASLASPHSAAFASVYEKSPNLARMPSAAVIDQGKASAYYDSASSHLASRSFPFLGFLLHIQRTVIEVTSVQLIKSRWQPWGSKVRRS